MSTPEEVRENLEYARNFAKGMVTLIDQAIDAHDASQEAEPAPEGLTEIARYDPEAPSDGWLISDSVEVRDGVAKLVYPAGWEGGSAPGYVSYESMPDDVRRVRVEARTRLSANFQGHPVVTKWGLIWTGGHPKIVMQMVGEGSELIYPEVWLQHLPVEEGEDSARNLGQNVHEVNSTFIRGEAHEWTVDVIQNTGDNADGAIRWWLDGILLGEHTGLRFTTADEDKSFPIVAWRPVWGGRGGTVAEEMYVEVESIRVLGA